MSPLQQQEQLAKTHESAERLSRTETDSRPASAVSRSHSDVADIRFVHFNNATSFCTMFVVEEPCHKTLIHIIPTNN